MRLGETLLLGISGEVFAETSLRLRELLPCPAFVIGMANGYDGYLPTAQAFAEGGYEVAVASCAVDSESRVLEAAVELERQLTAHPAGPRLVQA